jgi:hypothetical protein
VPTKTALEKARVRIAALLGAAADELYSPAAEAKRTT